MKIYLATLGAILVVIALLVATSEASVSTSYRTGSMTFGVHALNETKKAPNTSEVETLRQHVFDLMTTWAPKNTMPNSDIMHYGSVALDIATVVLDEAPIWKDDVNHSRTATLLTTIAFWEGHFWKHVDDGSCNDQARRKKDSKLVNLLARTGDCDGGYAYSIWQIHPEGGIVLTSDGGWKHYWDARSDDVVKYDGISMLQDRKVAARVALHMLRASVQRSGGLCAYTGEAGPCPKADQRMNFAREWMRKRPLN